MTLPVEDMKRSNSVLCTVLGLGKGVKAARRTVLQRFGHDGRRQPPSTDRTMRGTLALGPEIQVKPSSAT